jgi:ubiquinone/menaquinone biosynthesis C-methylase UbiE
MANPTSSTDETATLTTRYSSSAADYARHWSPVIRPMGQKLIRLMPLTSARRILDVGTGTGALTPDIRAVAPGALIVGVDGSLGMLEVAQESVTVPLAAMDIRHLGFESGSFDAAVMAFVLFHLPDPVQGLVEIGRVLRPGGVLGICVWGSSQSFGASDVWDEALSSFGAGPDPFQSTDRDELMDTPEKLAALLQEAKFEVARSWSEQFEHRWTADALIAQRTAFGSYQRRLDTLDATARGACLARVRERLDVLPPGDFAFRPDIIFAIARRPENGAQTLSPKAA